MNDRYFLDTNIIVYSYDKRDKRKQEISKRLIVDGITQNTASISYQVVQEFINVVTKIFEQPLSWSDCKLFVDRSLSLMWDINPSNQLIYSAMDIAKRWKFSFYDSLIIAAA